MPLDRIIAIVELLGRIVQIARRNANSLLLRLFCCHHTQVGGGADFSWVAKPHFLERRQVFFDRHEMGGAVTGWWRGIDMIADQNSSAWDEQAVKLSVQLWNTARVAELVDGL
jgi:hypothetical protein